MFVIENAKGRSSPVESSLGFGDDGFMLSYIGVVVDFCGLLQLFFISLPIKNNKNLGDICVDNSKNLLH